MTPSDDVRNETRRQEFAELTATPALRRQESICRLVDSMRATIEAAELARSGDAAIKDRGRPLQ